MLSVPKSLFLWLSILGITSVFAGEIFTGEGTYYIPSEVMSKTSIGACGFQISATDAVAAVSYKLFDSAPGATENPNNNPLCGQYITVRLHGDNSQKSVNVKVADRCHSCEGFHDIDLSQSSFAQLADLSRGRVTFDWFWANDAPRQAAEAEEDLEDCPEGSEWEVLPPPPPVNTVERRMSRHYTRAMLHAQRS